MALRVFALFSLALLHLIPVPGVASAQSRPVTGRVVDPQGAAIADAELTQVGSTQPRSVLSAPDGTFSFEGRTGGACTLRVSAGGSRPRAEPRCA